MYFTPNAICHYLKTDRRETPLEKMHVAIHEGAHATVAMAIGCRVTEAQIYENELRRWCGVVRHVHLVGTEIEKRTADALAILAPLAGSNSMESSIRSAFNWDSISKGDHEQIAEVADYFADLYTRNEFEARYRSVAYDILNANGKSWESITYALLRHHTLDEDDLNAVAGDVAKRWEARGMPASTTAVAAPASQKAVIARLHEMRMARKAGPGGIEFGTPLGDIAYR